MDNANSREYLSKIRDQCLENLRRTQHAPSVQMTDVPRDSLGGMNDDDEAALDDQDEDEYPDRRNTQRRADKYIEKNGELSDSEDEDINEQNGIRKQIAEKSRRARINYRGIQDVHNDSGMDSVIDTPAGGSSLPDIDNDVDMDEGVASAAPSLQGAVNDSALASGAVSPQMATDADTTMEGTEVAPAAPGATTEEFSAAQQEATPPDSPLHTSEPAPSSTLHSAAGPTTAADIKKEIEAEDTSIAAEAEGHKERDESDAEGQLQTEAAAEAGAKQETSL
jgi:histone deacetylase 1/2